MDEKQRYDLLITIEQAYTYWTKGETFPVPVEAEKNREWWLDQKAPFGLLVHDTQEDPVFIYANQRAQELFGYTQQEFLEIPSRKSAPSMEQQGRNQLLAEVAEIGIAQGYTGTRVDKQGNLFEITNVSVWKVLDAKQQVVAEAAMFWAK